VRNNSDSSSAYESDQDYEADFDGKDLAGVGADADRTLQEAARIMDRL